MNRQKTTQYDQIGRDYIEGQESFFQGNLDATRKFILSHLPKIVEGQRPKLLDVGCGFGADLKLYAQMGYDCYGIDASETMVQEARKRNPSLADRIHREDMANLYSHDLGIGLVDVVTARFSLHYLENIDEGYEKIGLSLLPKGLFVAILPHPVNNFARQKDKNYGNNEEIKFVLYGGKVPIHFRSKTFGDYFSSDFLKRFDLIAMHEGTEHDDDHIEGFQAPGYLAFAARKR